MATSHTIAYTGEEPTTEASPTVDATAEDNPATGMTLVSSEQVDPAVARDEGSSIEEESDNDPLEGFNRAMFTVHEGLDTIILKPVAIVYDAVTPGFVQTGVSNFFGNTNDILNVVYNLLQGNLSDALSDTGRVLVNTTIGIGGLVDVASELDLEKHNRDFGQTLAVWGVDSGPYVFLPVLGPRYARDVVGVTVDMAADPAWWIFHHDVRWRNSLLGLRLVNKRAGLLPTDKLVEQAALDKYAYIRDAYIQQRRYVIENNIARSKGQDVQAETGNEKPASDDDKDMNQRPADQDR